MTGASGTDEFLVAVPVTKSTSQELLDGVTVTSLPSKSLEKGGFSDTRNQVVHFTMIVEGD